ncbi:hypothetical protein BC939DRAFT_450873 [Gamsiella multidivaricata]|uniref:uncharacterized protein n=1 Tax=Gamsiella multidivaricata TaxID=101098 RepID=UPI00221FC86D|nr:uncharacterized protein BC939DRAFT_450873 [Gamsiella multidivaricata]KAI7823808.1 hypothetical protein BC939DRAFT_450873 [Gamsiella multidivaricata]
MESTTGNLPKSSKFLPGRVLRKARPRAQDLQYVTDASNVGLSSGSVSTADRGHRESMADDDEMLDPDCTSCRLVLNGFDKLLWKQARQAGEVNLNPKRWGKTAILCIACRMQYQRHHLRCTQCFYVPVIAEEMLGRPGAPKAGGTCSRCRAGTWLQEKDC